MKPKMSILFLKAFSLPTYAYFVNSVQGILARVLISRRGGVAGPYEVVVTIGLSDDRKIHHRTKHLTIK